MTTKNSRIVAVCDMPRKSPQLTMEQHFCGSKVTHWRAPRDDWCKKPERGLLALQWQGSYSKKKKLKSLPTDKENNKTKEK
jgi:hypothetical protein